MILRRNDLRKRSSNAKVSSQKFVSTKTKKTPKKSRCFSKKQKTTIDIDVLRNSVKKNVPSVNKVRKQANFTKSGVCTLPPVTKEYESAYSSQCLDDLNFIVSTPNICKQVKKKSGESIPKRSCCPSAPGGNFLLQLKKQGSSLTRKKPIVRKRKNNGTVSPKISEEREVILSPNKSTPTCKKARKLKAPPSLELSSTTRCSTRLAVRKNTMNSSQTNNVKRIGVKRAIDSKCVKKNNEKSVKNLKKSGENEVIRVSPRLAQKQSDEALSLTNSNANSIVKPSKIGKKNLQQSSASKNSFGENVRSTRNIILHYSRIEKNAFTSPDIVFRNNTETILGVAKKYTQNPSRSITKLKKTCKKNSQRRHTVSVLKKNSKKNKISASQNITVTGYSRNVTPLRQKASLRSNKKLKRQETDEYFYHLNNIPVDDLTVALVSSPNVSSNRSQSPAKIKSNAASTPCLNRKSAARQLKKKTCDKILPDDAINPKKHFPSRGTLKRKRWVINSLKERNQGYEDDLFESNQFDDFQEALQMEEDSDTSLMSIATPKCAFLVTPKLSTKTPRYKDCYSPVELLKARKVAEEYIHRRNKKKLKTSATSMIVSPDKEKDHQNEDSKMDSGVDVFGSPPEKKRLEFISLVKSLSEKNDKLETGYDSEEDVDVYFSDASP